MADFTLLRIVKHRWVFPMDNPNYTFKLDTRGLKDNRIKILEVVQM